jgi:flagellar basal-body rod protein FlgB
MYIVMSNNNKFNIIILLTERRMAMSINESSLDTNVYDLIKKSLDASVLRSKVSANNIANLNTKGYKAYKVSFEDTLQDSINGLELKTDNNRHITNTSNYGEISVKQDNTTAMNQDGNNVDIDSEMVDQAANSLMYNAMISAINSKLSQAKYVINGGR